MAPLKFTAEKTGRVTLYRGKASANAPFCDSSHAKLWSAEPEDPEPVVNVTSAVPMAEEPTGARMHEVAHHGLTNLGHHGKMGSMGCRAKAFCFGMTYKFGPRKGPENHCLIMRMLQPR